MKDKLSKVQIIIPPFLLSIITFISYYGSLSYNFIYDDLPTIARNVNVIKGHFLNIKAFSCPRWISRWIQTYLYQNFQAKTFAYRLTSVFIHITIGIMIFFLLLKLLTNLKKNCFLKENAYWISIITCALFLVYPTQTQTVSYITQMTLEGLVVLFLFAILIAFSYASTTENHYLKFTLYFLCIILTIFSSGTKDISVVIPLLVILTDLFFIAQGSWNSFKKRIFVHLIIWICFWGAYLYTNKSFFKFIKFSFTTPISSNRGNVITEYKQQKITTFLYMISQFKILLHYLRIYIWPFNLGLDYGCKLSKRISDLDVIIPLLTILSIWVTALVAFIKKQTNVFSFSMAWFFITILPRASIFPSTEIICDYKTYISSFGALFLVSVAILYLIKMATSFLEGFIKIKQKNIIQFSILATLIIFLSIATNNRNFVWSGELAFWGDALKTSPDKAGLYNNLGIALYHSGEIDKAIKTYNTACKIDPEYAEPIINLAFHYQSIGDKKTALEHYKRALALPERHPEMFLNLGVLHLSEGSLDKAETCLKAAIKFRSSYSKARFSLGLLYQKKDMFKLAYQEFKKALAGDYQDINYFYNHGMVCYKLQKYKEAITSLETVKKNNQNLGNTLFVLGNCYYEENKFKEASENFELSLKKNPNNDDIAYNLAQSLIKTENYKKALDLFKRCAGNAGKYPYAQMHIATCLAQTNNKSEAIETLNKVIQSAQYKNVQLDAVNLKKELCA